MSLLFFWASAARVFMKELLTMTAKPIRPISALVAREVREAKEGRERSDRTSVLFVLARKKRKRGVKQKQSRARSSWRKCMQSGKTSNVHCSGRHVEREWMSKWEGDEQER